MNNEFWLPMASAQELLYAAHMHQILSQHDGSADYSSLREAVCYKVLCLFDGIPMDLAVFFRNSAMLCIFIHR